MSVILPQGFHVAGVHCGLKEDPAKEDLTLIVADAPATAAGVYTQNVVYAPAVGRNRELTPTDDFRAVVVNSGNANTCTGERGIRDNEEMARLTAEQCGADPSQVLVMSTGIIGEYLPMDAIAGGIMFASEKLGTDDRALLSAARGFTTTDKSHKLVGRSITCDSRRIQITGLAKGAGMIGPRMATMLCAVLTDAQLAAADAQESLRDAVNHSFNCISVEGHMSTSDTVLLLASGKAGGKPLVGDDLQSFHDALREVCIELARMIPDDGEGASHLIDIQVSGCATRQAAHQIAQTIANSALVKTGVAGADPNWGRIVSAAGYAGVQFNPHGFELRVNGTLLYRLGTPIEFDESEMSRSIRDQRETFIELAFSEGAASARFWTSDLTIDYVRFNSDYHT